MKRITGIAVVTILAAILSPAASTATPDINSAVVIPRVFNDCPGSIFSSTNNYPSLISMTDMNQNCLGFANLHLWRLSSDGMTPAEFANADAFRVCADLRISGSGEAEAGLQISPWWSMTDGRLNVNTVTGEIAAFGGRLPFYSFSNPMGYGLTYTKGDLIHLEVIYRPNGLTEPNPATIEYIVDGMSSGQLPFDMGTAAEDPPHGLWGILTPAQVGGHFQFFLSQSGPTGSATVEWTNICYEALEGELFACPRGLGFWRQQCAQRGNGSTKVCEEGMGTLWRCLISDTGIIQWRDNEGSFVTTASLMGMSDADLSSALCDQLQGPRPMRSLDKAEIQYLVLKLNICVGALSTSIPVSNGFEGTIGELLDSLETAINTGEDLEDWMHVADSWNAETMDCPNADSLFTNVEPCTTNGNGNDNGKGDNGNGNGSRKHSSRADGGLQAGAHPNPVVGGATAISFRVPDNLGSSEVEIAVHDLSGRLVRKLLSGAREPGSYSVEWDLRDGSGASVPAGIYFYRVAVGGTEVTRKLMVSR